LLDTTEKFCKDRAVHNAVLDGIKILDNKDKTRTPEAIPSILADALAFHLIIISGTIILKMRKQDLIGTIQKKRNIHLIYLSLIELQKVVFQVKH